MRKLLFRFLLFLAVIWLLGQVALPVVMVGIGMVMVLMSALHIWATPSNQT